MPNIYQRVERYFRQDRERVIKQVKKELQHTMLKERFRGVDWPEKLKAIITIWTA